MDYVRARAEINLGKLRNNLSVIRQIAPAKTAIMLAVKADAYGHGVQEVAKAAVERGVSWLGVALCEEGLALRRFGIKTPVLVMSRTPKEQFKEAISQNLSLTVTDSLDIEALDSVARAMGKTANIHIKIDTGMGRLGFTPGHEAVEQICRINNLDNARIEGVMTHLATSDSVNGADFMFEQYKRFFRVLKDLRRSGVNLSGKIIHAGNSGMLQAFCSGVFKPDFCPFLDMLRVGITAYGLPSSADYAQNAAQLGLSPIMRLVARVSLTKTVPSGSGISYGHTFTTKRVSKIATIPLGYADGLPRLLSNKGYVRVGGILAPYVGAICMDQCMIDVTDVKGDLNAGDEVEIFGTQSPTVHELAELIGTISYEILCGVGKRVPRAFLDDQSPRHQITARRGDVFYADLSPVIGSEQGGSRPVLVIQNDKGNRHSPTVICAAITSQTGKARLPTHVLIAASQTTLGKDSVVLMEQLRSVDKRRLHDRVCRLDPETMRRVDKALAISIGLITLKRNN